MILQTGVYQIRNILNGKVYVGSAGRSFERRFIEHRSRLNTGTHWCKHFQRAWDKYGSGVFVFEVLERCPPDRAVEREQVWMDLKQAYLKDKGYNARKIAASNLGFKPSRESVEKMAATKRGKKLSPESIAKRTLKQKGIKRSAETKKRMSEARRSSEKVRLSYVAKRGVERPSEVRAKISAARKGKPFSEEHKRALSEAQKRRYAKPSTGGIK